ncbi:hypothetical protein Godav_023394, partial [Gossypium davidsonii]|nr:hypothetical protein [Gossypium davidsonii]MBA0671087.1 hypothetical protein [Gossypium klotzschianum]
MLFKSKDNLKEAANQYDRLNSYFIKFPKNDLKSIKGILFPKIKKKLDVNIKDSLRCVPSHVGGDRYQVECGPSSQHVVDLVENSCSCRK